LVLFVHTASALIWLVVASGWLFSQPAPGGATLARILFALWLGILALAGLYAKDALKKLPLLGPLVATGAALAQWLLPHEALPFACGMGAGLLLLLPLSRPTDRWHALAGGLALAGSLVVASLGVWPSGTLHVEPALAGTSGLVWGLLAFAVLEGHRLAQSTRLPQGGLVLSGSSSLPEPQRTKGAPVVNTAAPGITAVAPPSASSSSLRAPRVRSDEDPSSPPPEETTASDPTQSQILSRSMLLEQEVKARAQMSELLEPVVLFMNKNFRPHSALGFLVDHATGNLRIDTAFGKGKVMEDATIVPGQGLLGGILGRSGGFITGDISVYGQPPEYYPENERVLSMMAMPVRNEETNELQALLVVDSQSPRAFNDSHFEWLRRFGSIASALVTVQHAKTAVARQAKITEAFYEIQSRLTKHLKIEELLGVLDGALLDLFQFDRLIFASWNPQKQKAQVVHLAGTTHGLERGALFDLSDPKSFYGGVFRTRQERMINDLANEHLFDGSLDKQLGTLPAEVLCVPLLNDDRKCIGVLGVEALEAGRYSQMDLKLLAAIASIASNALSRAHMYQQMERLATIDGLTQIPNHRHFQTLVTQQMEQAARYSQPASLLLFDIDHFKSFNDTYGHPIGDQVLKEVAKCVQGAVRASDILARYGGEEFVVYLPQTDSTNAMMSAERVRSAVEALEIPHESGKTLRVTISIGVCTFPDLADAKQMLIDNADKAMYFSKKTGRNRCSLYGPDSEALAVAKEVGPPQPGH